MHIGAARFDTAQKGALRLAVVAQTPAWDRPQRMQEGGYGSGKFGDPAGIGVQLSDASLGKSRFISSSTSAPLDLKVTTM